MVRLPIIFDGEMNPYRGAPIDQSCLKRRPGCCIGPEVLSPLIIKPDKVSAEDMKKGVVLLILY
jgi:hypothetical protein